MNEHEQWLDAHFQEVDTRYFYRTIFPDGELEKRGERVTGKYVGIIIAISKEKKESGKPVIKRYTVTDDLDAVEAVTMTDSFCLMSPLSYAGKTRTADHARFVYAIAVDVDHLKEKDGKSIGMAALWERHIESVGRLPKPTFIVSSGTGIHLYFVLSRPISLFPETARQLQIFKRELTRMIWHGTIVTPEAEENIQQEGIYQGFRMPGTITKSGGIARAFKTGEKVSMEYLNSFVSDEFKVKDFGYKRRGLSREEAKEKYPEWYARRVDQKEKRGVWHVNRAVYEWWRDEIRKKAVVGHRYYCMMLLSIYAQKCSYYDPKHNPNPVTREELERDSLDLLDHMESMTDSEDNHFTSMDVLDALEAFNEKWVTYPKRSVEFLSAIRLPENRRNGRKQEQHLQVARAIQAVTDPAGTWRQGNGRKPKRDTVKAWRLNHPDGTQSACARETGLSRPTVIKWWTE